MLNLEEAKNKKKKKFALPNKSSRKLFTQAQFRKEENNDLKKEFNLAYQSSRMLFSHFEAAHTVADIIMADAL